MAGLTSELNAVANYLFSRNRRLKAGILVREALMQLPLPGSGSAAPTEALPQDPPVDVWSYEQRSKIDPEFYKVRTKAATNDRLDADGLIHTNQDHQVHCLYGASTYTNESTHRSIFDRDGKRIEPLSYSRSPGAGPSRLRIRPQRIIPGRTANLYSTKACAEANYAHWLIDALAHLFLIERFHPLESIDQVLVPPLKHDFQWDSLEAFGFTKDQIIELRPLDCFGFECLLAASAPRGTSSSVCPGWAIDRYHEVLVTNAQQVPSVGGKRIYISRRDAPNRKFQNETQVCELLEARGFDIVELTPLDLSHKIAVFRDADVVIGQTGAGLTNLMFCNEGATVLELVDKRFVDHLYASLAAYRGVRHVPHFFENETPLGKLNSIVVQSALDISALEQSLDKLGL